jgi:hypothetical protein
MEDYEVTPDGQETTPTGQKSSIYINHNIKKFI